MEAPSDGSWLLKDPHVIEGWNFQSPHLWGGERDGASDATGQSIYGDQEEGMEAWDLSHSPGPMQLFHPAVPELYPFTRHQ